MRFQRQQAVKRCVGTIAFVFVSADFLLAHYLVGLLVQHRFHDFHGSDLFVEQAFPLSSSRALLAQQRVFVLRLPPDFVAFSHDFRGVAHDHVHARQFLQQAGIGVGTARRHSNALDAAANHRLAATVNDLVSGQSDRLQARGTEAVNRGARDRCGQACEHGGNSGDVAALRTMRLPATEHDIFHFAWIKVGSLPQDILDAVCRKIIGPRHIERAPERLRQRRA